MAGSRAVFASIFRRDNLRSPERPEIGEEEVKTSLVRGAGPHGSSRSPTGGSSMPLYALGTIVSGCILRAFSRGKSIVEASALPQDMLSRHVYSTAGSAL